MSNLLIVAGLCSGNMLWAANHNGYRITPPDAFPVIATNAPSAWATTNGGSMVWAVGGSAQNTNGEVPAATNAAHQVTFRLESSSFGQPIQHILPEYYLGDKVTAPSNVDWSATAALFESSAAASNHWAFFAPSVPGIYFSGGGAITVEWVLQDGTSETNTYIVSGSSKTRPYRIYWTEEPYNAPLIDLTGRFVRFHGPEALITPVYGEVTEELGGTIITHTNVVRGLYVDPATHFLHAYGEIEGHVVLQYFRTGNLDEQLASIVVQICRPDIETVPGAIGEELKPTGDGHSPVGLVARISAGLTVPGDPLGPYVYQHSGLHSYSPKNGDVFALRKTVDAPWKIEMYWEDEDPMGTRWPFEVLHYACDWPADADCFVRGNVDGNLGTQIVIPEGYHASLMEYQQPTGMAWLTGSNTFYTTGPGDSLLKLKANDNIWFVPIRSIWRTDDLCRVDDAALPWPIGTELRPMLTNQDARQVLYEDYSEYHGYLYHAASSGCYNTNLYQDPVTIALAQRNGSAVADPTSNSPIAPDETYIFGVNTDEKPLEVWWSHKVQQPDMPAPLWIPSLVQQYSQEWPEHVPEIVLASQLGSACTSIVQQGSSLLLADGGQVNLTGGLSGFSGNFTVECWAKWPVVPAEPAVPLFQFWEETEAADQERVLLYAPNGGTVSFHVDLSEQSVGTVTTAELISSNVWTHLACTVSNGTGRVYVNGVLQQEQTGLPALSADVMRLNRIGGGSSPEVELDEVRIWSHARSAAEIAAARFESMTGPVPGLTAAYTLDQLGADFEAATTRELLTRRLAVITDGEWVAPGAPAFYSGVLQSTKNPVVYTQNDAAQRGFNPNEEHAFIQAADDGYVAYALRNDLNTDDSSEPYVLVQYHNPALDGRPDMQAFRVVTTNSVYSAFAASMTAGSVVPGPHPLDLLANPWNTNTVWETNNYATGACPGFRDRELQVWAKNAGELRMHNWYPMQAGFWFPSLSREEQPALNTPVPWLSRMNLPAADVLTGTPARWTWTVEWPAEVPQLDIGETLTTAKDMLPEVWNAKSMELAYQQYDGSVELYDPTVAQSAPLSFSGDFASAFGFDLGPTGNIADRNGLYYFSGVPPGISDRFYFDPFAPQSKCLKLKGEWVSHAGGLSWLMVNVLTPEERTALEALSTNSAWAPAIENLATHLVTATPELPVDHYALTAVGQGGGYVTLLENNATNLLTGVKPGDPINMHILQVSTNLYVGGILPLEDPNNLLSQQLDILYTEFFAGRADEFEFEWRHLEPQSDGTTPSTFDEYHSYLQTNGLTRFTIGKEGDTLVNMVNDFFVMRYRATTNAAAYETVGSNWSEWVGPTLAEGWVERVLSNVTPFEQRMRDLYDNPVETDISMIQQAGGPYLGPVALNQDNLDNVGLIQLYQTLLDMAESLSLTLGVNNTAANQQLMLAATRLNDLYMLLGNEAYADAMNPTIGFGNTFATSDNRVLANIDYGALHSSLFCFDNQVPSLLDEELALLRGRSTPALGPPMKTEPYYNRLMWNYTKGITAGEVAYSVNYDIMSNTDVVIDAATAAELYPQGHGDAWGHYTSALYGYYRLMRNPYFSWGVPSITPMMVDDAVVDADYYDEEKFAEAAAAMARAAADVVERTCIKSWLESDGLALAGYVDEDSGRAFGYGEWGARAGLASLYNWAAANSLLPAADVSTNFVDDGILRINRDSVGSLDEIAAAMSLVQRRIDLADGGMTPLGLSDNAIPFDIDPSEIDAGKTHFEQILERAEASLNNAETVLNRAQTSSTLLRQQEQMGYNFEQALLVEESTVTEELIAIYGYPYEDDIGPSGTYPQGYDGPDLYHYMWMDFTQYGFSEIEIKAHENVAYDVEDWDVLGLNKDEDQTRTIRFTLASNGMIIPPDYISGTRRAQGRIQDAYSGFLQAYQSYDQSLQLYKEMHQLLEKQADAYQMNFGVSILMQLINDGSKAYSIYKMAGDIALMTEKQVSLDVQRTVHRVLRMGDAVTPDMIIGGMAFGTDIGAPIKASLYSAMGPLRGTAAIAAVETELAKEILELTSKVKTEVLALIKENLSLGVELHKQGLKLEKSVAEFNTISAELTVAVGKLIQAQEVYRTVQAEGENLLATRERLRRQSVNRIAAGRYNDMAFRVFRNDALAKYSSAFELAQKYTYLAAKAYDYETGLLSTDVRAGNHFYKEIIAARTLGHLEGGEPQLGGLNGDGGLADILARMKNNWLVLDGRLGFNNPQRETGWISLREELFRLPLAAGSDADWRETLESYWVDNLLTHPDFRRYCQPFESTSGLEPQEPGLVIPFSTTIDFGQNVFGWPLAGGDNAFDSSHYATKIRNVGIQFVRYNDSSVSATALANEPRVYLIPVGKDIMRAPGSQDGQLCMYDVVDQVVPLPYPIGDTQLDDPDWIPLLDAVDASGDALAKIRRYPSMRAYHDQGDFESSQLLSSSRLVGRSVWNTRWLLIIPAGTLHADRNFALDTLINGADLNDDSTLDQPGIQDIQLGFKTYSHSGN